MPNFQHGDPVLGANANEIFGEFFVQKVMEFDGLKTPQHRQSSNYTETTNYLRKMRPGEIASQPTETNFIDSILTKSMHYVLDTISHGYCEFYLRSR